MGLQWLGSHWVKMTTLLFAAESEAVSLSSGFPDSVALELLKILFGKRYTNKLDR